MQPQQNTTREKIYRQENKGLKRIQTHTTAKNTKSYDPQKIQNMYNICRYGLRNQILQMFRFAGASTRVLADGAVRLPLLLLLQYKQTANSRKCFLKTHTKDNVTQNSNCPWWVPFALWPSFECVVWEPGPVRTTMPNMCISGLYYFYILQFVCFWLLFQWNQW